MSKLLLAIAAALLLLTPALGERKPIQIKEPATPLDSKTLEYKDGETVCEGYISRLVVDEDKTVPRAAVLIVHDWMGLKQFEKDKADELARMGYIAFAVDIYGKGVRPADAKAAAAESGKYRKDPALAVSRITSAFETLKAQPGVDAKRIGCMGYCFGGSITLALARSGAALAAGISFHGGLANGQGKSEIKAAMLVLHGADDPFVPRKDVDALREEFTAAKIDWQLVEFGNSVHSFTNPAAGNDNSKGAAYNEKADKRSWEMMRDFFAETLK